MKMLPIVFAGYAAAAVIAGIGTRVALSAKPLEPDTTMVFREHGVRMTVGALQSGTRKIFARWSIATNELGDATSYAVVWKVSRSDSASGAVVTYQRVVTTLSDTLRVYEPVAPDSTRVQVSVWARRRGLQSVDSVYAFRVFRRADAPPPPPGPVRIDTLATLQLVIAKPTLDMGSTTEACILGTTLTGVKVLLFATLNAADTLITPTALTDPRYTICRNAVWTQRALLPDTALFVYVGAGSGNEGFELAWRKAN